MAAIPNRIHFIFGLHPDFGGKPFSFIHYLAVLSASIVNKPDEIILHYRYLPSGVWWDLAKPYLLLDQVPIPESVEGRPVSHFAHKADVLRLNILEREGGIYLDMDTFCIRPFTPLLTHSTVLGIEPNAGLCNAVILAEKNAPFIGVWKNGYSNFSDDNWRSHSVRLPYFLARENPDLIHVENEYAFFFPTYDDPMHRLLWSGEISFIQRSIGILRILAKSTYYLRGDRPKRVIPYIKHTLSSSSWYYSRLRNAYCMHHWENIWWDSYLKTVSPKTLRSSDGLFARLVVDVIGKEMLDSLPEGNHEQDIVT
jgi:hypothetical protein